MQPNDAPVVDTTGGRVRGTRDSGLAVFRGIPYAAPPVGERRWRATEPHPGWGGVRDAREFGAICPQPTGLGFDAVLGVRGRAWRHMSEDCLYLNVWTPGADDARRPVLLWIHGGGNISGAGSWDVYSCETFARTADVVGVSINYRLGPLGHLLVGHEGEARANFWLDDMLTALRWVRGNIAAFGGDPDNVTVAGQSGGAVSIAWMLGLADVRGLVRRAILQSPPVGEAGLGIEEATETTARYFAALGVRDVAEARQLHAARLLAPLGELTRAAGGWGLFKPAFSRVIDKHSLHAQVVDGLSAADTPDVDLLIGWTREEHSFFFAIDDKIRAATAEQVVRRARLPFGDAAEDAYAAYANARPGARPVEILTDITTDERFRIGSLELADTRARQGRPTYVFQLDFPTPAFDGLLGAPHCFELPFVFNNWPAWSDAVMLIGTDSPHRQALSDTMHRAWCQFIRTGDPNHQRMPSWEPYTADRHTIMSFDRLTEPVVDLGGHRRRIWYEHGGQQR